MNSLEKPKKATQTHRVKTRIRLIGLNKVLRPLISPRRRRKRRRIKENVTNKRTDKIVTQLIEVMPNLSPLQNEKILAKSSVITLTKRVISSEIVPSQKS